MNAALYVRVSDEDQAVTGSSIEAQKALLLRKCTEWGYSVVDVYTDDGFSAKNMRRPALQKMLKDLGPRKIGVIVFWRLDRFTRRNRDFHKLMEMLETTRTGFRSATENYDTTTAMGRFQLELAISLGQLERETTAERVHFVMQERHLKGKRNGAVAPYGYDLVDGKLVVNPDQAEVVRHMFRLYSEHLAGFREIAVTINRERSDREWNYSTVRYVLLNPVYAGKLRWNYRKSSGRTTGREIIVDADHEPIIDELTFSRVYREIKGRSVGGKSATSDFAFAGILRCGRCGYAMTGFSAQKSSGRYRYYRCSHRAQTGKCDMPTVSVHKVEEAFLASLDYDPGQLRQFMNLKLDNTHRDREQHVDKLKKELESITRRKKKWQLAYAEDVITLEELKERTREDKEREEQIQQELEGIPQDEGPRMTADEIIGQLARVREMWHETDDEKAKKAFLRDIFESITVNSETGRGQGAPGKFVEVTVTDFKPRI